MAWGLCCKGDLQWGGVEREVSWWVGKGGKGVEASTSSRLGQGQTCLLVQVLANHLG